MMSKTKAMIRVNHAGEYGAVRIYAGQLAALKNTAQAPIIEHMKTQEEEHLKFFTQLIHEREIRPTVFQPLWHVGGFMMGYITGLLGEKAAHACTVAVEEVIENHYGDQIHCLAHDGNESDLRNIIERCQADEISHKHMAQAEISKQSYESEVVPYPVLSTVIRGISRAAIWLSTRL